MATRITGSAPPRTRGDRDPRANPPPARPASRVPVPPGAGRPGLTAVLALGTEAPPRARTAAPPKTAPRAAPSKTAARAAPPKAGPPRAVPPKTTPKTAPSKSAPSKSAPPTGPVPRATPRAATGAASPDTADVSGARRRMPFLLLIVGMLSGALVCLLVISTTLAAGSFRITSLQQQDQALAKQQQQLQQQVAQDQAPSVIAQRAEQLGMRPVTQLEFLNVKTGKISSDAATGADAQIQVPGYTP